MLLYKPEIKPEIITINVDQGDIDHGIKLASSNCMVVLAMRRAGFEGDIRVTGAYLHWDNKIFSLPKSVEDKINRWDAGMGAKPFSFDLEMY